ncbi:MAG: chromate efflux transporter [Gemmatimonadetes bacterium]|nr:chromate efflux transporter [Gemmatimonadota bacterium]
MAQQPAGDDRDVHDAIDHAASRGTVGEVARVFSWLGVSAFGGPAAHIAAMEDALVTRRRWLTREAFVDLVGAANLIPGPNSTELAIHLGYRRAGWPGLFVAGACFILPAVAIVWGLAVAYVAFGTRVEVQAMLAGVQPVVLAVVVQALWRLRAAALRDRVTIGIALAVLVGVVAGVHELVLLAAAVLVGVWRGLHRDGAPPPATGALGMLALPPVPSPSPSPSPSPLLLLAPAAIAASASSAALSAWVVFRHFVTIGSVLYGSGYVLLAFLRSTFVDRLHVLSEAQLLDAIAIGQVTPGPVFSAATFVGYLLAGHAGAAAATVGIFLPAFVGVAVTAPLVHRMRRSPRVAPVLDAVNAASLALLGAVVLVMARGVGGSALSVAIFLLAALLLLRTRVGAGWLLLAGGLAGAARLL